jgi:YegS/Rv2252/BmrU family lipid kinase
VRRAVLVYNPIAGTRKRASLIPDIVAALEPHGVEVEPAPTTGPGAAVEIAREVATSANADTVLALGGDGTIREVAKGLLGSPVALGPLPGGTTNIVSRALGLPLNPLKAAVALAGARTIEADVGLCNDEPFLLLTSLGIDAAIMDEASTRLKNLFGRLGVAITAMKTWLTYDYPEVSYTADGRSGTATFLAVCNIAHYAGDYLLAPQAHFTDHRLHLVTFTGTGPLATARFVTRLVFGRHGSMREVEIRPVEQVTVPAPLPSPLQLDGDAISHQGPLNVRLSPERVVLLTCRP